MLSAFHSKDLTLFSFIIMIFFLYLRKWGQRKSYSLVWDFCISMLPGHRGYEIMKVKGLFLFSKGQRVLTAG